MAALPQVLFVPGREMTLKQAQIKAKNLDKSLGGSIACCRVLPKAKEGKESMETEKRHRLRRLGQRTRCQQLSGCGVRV